MKRFLIVCGPSLVMSLAFALINPSDFNRWGWLACIAFSGVMVSAASIALGDS